MPVLAPQPCLHGRIAQRHFCFRSLRYSLQSSTGNSDVQPAVRTTRLRTFTQLAWKYSREESHFSFYPSSVIQAEPSLITCFDHQKGNVGELRDLVPG